MKKNNNYNWSAVEKNIQAYIQKEQKNIELKDTPLYPLAFHAKMPENADFENGHLSFKFKDFSINGLEATTLAQNACTRKKNRIHMTLRMDQLQLKARYEIYSKFADRITMDTGGNLMEFDESYSREAGTSDNDVQPLSPTEIDTMVTQARDQKPKIQGTYHGPSLLSRYNEHSESYNSAFVVSANLRQAWASGGITTQMSRDTHDALNDGTIINDKTYSNNLSYNGNAGTQQSNVAIALKVMALKAKSEKNEVLEQKYNAAAKSAASFQNQVNPNDSAPKSTGADVYKKLNDKSETIEEMSDEEFKNMMDQASDDNSKDGGAAAEARKNGWRVLKEEERKSIRERLFLFQEELLKLQNVEPELLWTGDCHASLHGAEATITLDYNESASQWDAKECDVTLPAFAIDIDDSFWTGKTADVVRERLASIHFVKSLLQTKIQSGIENLVEKSVISGINLA